MKDYLNFGRMLGQSADETIAHVQRRYKGIQLDKESEDLRRRLKEEEAKMQKTNSALKAIMNREITWKRDEKGDLVAIGDDCFKPVASTHIPFWAKNNKISPPRWEDVFIGDSAGEDYDLMGTLFIDDFENDVPDDLDYGSFEKLLSKTELPEDVLNRPSTPGATGQPEMSDPDKSPITEPPPALLGKPQQRNWQSSDPAELECSKMRLDVDTDAQILPELESCPDRRLVHDPEEQKTGSSASVAPQLLPRPSARPIAADNKDSGVQGADVPNRTREEGGHRCDSPNRDDQLFRSSGGPQGYSQRLSKPSNVAEICQDSVTKTNLVAEAEIPSTLPRPVRTGDDQQSLGKRRDDSGHVKAGQNSILVQGTGAARHHPTAPEGIQLGQAEVEPSSTVTEELLQKPEKTRSEEKTQRVSLSKSGTVIGDMVSVSVGSPHKKGSGYVAGRNESVVDQGEGAYPEALSNTLDRPQRPSWLDDSGPQQGAQGLDRQPMESLMAGPNRPAMLNDEEVHSRRGNIAAALKRAQDLLASKQEFVVKALKAKSGGVVVGGEGVIGFLPLSLMAPAHSGRVIETERQAMWERAPAMPFIHSISDSEKKELRLKAMERLVGDLFVVIVCMVPESRDQWKKLVVVAEKGSWRANVSSEGLKAAQQRIGEEFDGKVSSLQAKSLLVTIELATESGRVEAVTGLLPVSEVKGMFTDGVFKLGSEISVTLQTVDTKRGFILLASVADSVSLPQTFDAGATSVQSGVGQPPPDNPTTGDISESEDLSESLGDMPHVVQACKWLAIQPGVLAAKPGKRVTMPSTAPAFHILLPHQDRKPFNEDTEGLHQYCAVGRHLNDLQEVLIQTVLSREGLKAAIEEAVKLM